MLISLAFDIYTHVMSIFGLYLMFSQFDFLMIRMIADCIVTMFTTWYELFPCLQPDTCSQNPLFVVVGLQMTLFE